jgi:hypothetical protein
VNAYTGHSFNAHTALKYYYKLDKNWAGNLLRASPLTRIPLSAKTLKVIKSEADEEGQDDEDDDSGSDNDHG